MAIVALNPDGFSRWELNLPTNISSFNKKWFIFINPKVTNIDAFMYAQGSLLSYNGSKIFIEEYYGYRF